jgi:hypothetical protein
MLDDCSEVERCGAWPTSQLPIKDVVRRQQLHSRVCFLLPLPIVHRRGGNIVQIQVKDVSVDGARLSVIE